MFRNIANGTPEELQLLSQHPVDNAWKKVIFCDTVRGLFGSLCGDIMHCLQHGLYIYLLQILFEQKQVIEVSQLSKDNDSNYLTGIKGVFSLAYSRRFDDLARKYGKLLVHQNDRDLPGTLFQSNYTSTTQKNSNEMTGILIAVLMVFSLNENCFIVFSGDIV